MPNVDFGIRWIDLIKDSIEDRANLDADYWTDGALNGTPYYASSYKCPLCRGESNALMKIKLVPGVRTNAPGVFGQKEVGLWNLFTCPQCHGWFASINYLEGVFDLSEVPGYSPLAAEFSLAKYCLVGVPMEYSAWTACVRKTLKYAK